MAGEQARSGAAGASQGFAAGFGRRWRWIAAATLASLIGSAVFVIVVPPRYAGVASLVLDEPRRALAGPDRAPGEATEPPAEAESLATPDLARAAVAKLGLAGTAEFGGAGAPDRDAVEAFLSRLTIAASPRSRALAVTFVARDPDLAARGANTVADLVVQSRNEDRTKAARAVETWLDQKIADWKSKVADAETKGEAMRAQSRQPSESEGTSVAGDSLAELNAKLSGARAAAAAAEAKAEVLRSFERGAQIPDAAQGGADPALRRLIDQRAALKAEIADASRTLLPLHPRMKDLAAQLASVEGEIREAADKAARGSEGEARRAATEADALAARLDDETKAAQAASAATLAAASAADGPLRAVEAEAQTARDELQAYQQMAREAETRRPSQSGEGDARVLVRAEPPRAPVFPRVWPTVLGATAAAFLLSALAAVAALVASGRRLEPLPARVGPPMARESMAAIPTAREAEFRALANVAASPAAAPAGALDSAVGLVAALKRLRPQGGLVVLIAGDRTGQALAIGLETARKLAADRPAAFVDLGETQDWLADILTREESDAPAMPGLRELIAGRAGFADVIRRDLSSRLDVVLPGSGGTGANISDALTAFAAAYAAVVLHASDWRGDWARAAATFADAVAIVAPAARAGAALDAAEAALGEACPTVLAYAVRAVRKAPEPVG